MLGWLLQLLARSIGIARAVRASAYLDIVVLALTVAQLDQVASYAPAFFWSIVVAAAFCSPLDTVAVTVLGALAIVLVPLRRGSDTEIVIVIDAITLVAGDVPDLRAVCQDRG